MATEIEVNFTIEFPRDMNWQGINDLLLGHGQCIPSREGLYSAFQIPSRYLQDAPPIPVEEDNVFAPRKLEKIPNRT